uniref:Uncharacterized protein n=1 Tax=Meloidogyne enterolobii TaxID=390850 RepID=A0A6V7VFJ6_MELEN|nr:unnamed protein product [Meloidogyne enterolobii]
MTILDNGNNIGNLDFEIVMNNEAINKSVYETLNFLDKNKNIKSLNKALNNFETNIELKSKILKCGLYGKILHFTALEIDNEDKIEKSEFLTEEEFNEMKEEITKDIDNYLIQNEGFFVKKEGFLKIFSSKNGENEETKREKLKKIHLKYKLRKLFLLRLKIRLAELKGEKVEGIGLKF